MRNLKNLKRDSLAALLEEVAKRLEAAPAEVEARAVAATERGINPAYYQVGGLEQSCKQEAHAIRYLIANYLAPKAAPVRGKR